MYCPKCKERFEEGSRRFCPTDGSRLVSEATGTTGRQGGGIFANLIPKIDAISDLEDLLTNAPHSNAADPAGKPPEAPVKPVQESFFDFEDEEPVQPVRPAEQVKDIAPFDPNPIPRRPDPPHPPTEPVKHIAPFDPGSTQNARNPEPAPPPTEPAKHITPFDPDPVPVARKIDPFEIPAGHVELGSSNRPGASAEFDLAHPERFVGRIVKGRYRVTEFLGGDETGLSYLADDQIVVDKKVLVRILSEDGYDEIMRSILAEERISLSHFSHPNVARLIDSGQFTNGTNFLISEFFDALSVNDILTIHGQFDLARTARVIKQAAGALSEAHQEGIIHRDIRPQNLILDDTSVGEPMTVKVVSFGASNGEPTEQNILYKAPEVLQGRISTVASDIFSLGVVAYEMLTGQMPFEGSTPKDLARSQNYGLKGLPSKLRPALNASVDGIISKALSHNSADRYPKARDFGDALFAALTVAPEPAIVPANPFEGEIKQGETSIEPFGAPVPSQENETGVEPYEVPTSAPSSNKSTFITIKPAARVVPTEYPPVPRNPLLKPVEEQPVPRRSPMRAIVIAVVLLALIGGGWYFLVQNRTLVDRLLSSLQTGPSNSPQTDSPTTPATEVPPGNFTPPANSVPYENNKQNLKGDLLQNFVGFDIYYPKDWKVNGPQQSKTASARGKFLDISRSTPDGRMKEQMLVSYYASKGTFGADGEKFKQMVNETNQTLSKLLPSYQMVSEGETTVNGFPAYEVKFQGGGTSPTGAKLIVWGKRLFVPTAKPGAPNGFEITMLATSLADNVRSVDDVGVRGELADILRSFKPN